MRNPTFRQLVEELTRGGIAKGEKPKSIVSLVSKCKISRPSFYNMLTGSHGVSEKAIQRVAKGLGLDFEKVKAAVEKSRAIAEMAK